MPASPAPAPATNPPRPDTLVINGPLVVRTAETWHARCATALAGARTLTIDLAECPEADAFGLQLLYAARRSAEQQGQGFRLLGFSPALDAACRRAGFARDHFRDLDPLFS